VGPFRQPRKNPLFFLVIETGIIAELAERALTPGLGVFSAKMHPVRNGFAIQVELDGLEHPLGAVTVGQCEEFSLRLGAVIDEQVREKPSLMPGLTEENYTLEVSSAGAERELRLPEELERFKDQPLKVLYQKEDKMETALLVCKGKEADGAYAFEAYVARRRKGKKKPALSLRLEVSLIKRANLFLDF